MDITRDGLDLVGPDDERPHASAKRTSPSSGWPRCSATHHPSDAPSIHIDIHDLDPLPTYVNGRVAPARRRRPRHEPDRGQGAGQSIEDADGNATWRWRPPRLPSPTTRR
jgi:hypothetical protein